MALIESVPSPCWEYRRYSSLFQSNFHGSRIGKILQEGHGPDSIDDIPLLRAQIHALHKILFVRIYHV